jgi:hypothetical protein
VAAESTGRAPGLAQLNPSLRHRLGPPPEKTCLISSSSFLGNIQLFSLDFPTLFPHAIVAGGKGLVNFFHLTVMNTVMFTLPIKIPPCPFCQRGISMVIVIPWAAPLNDENSISM